MVDEPWDCPYPSLSNSNYCIFHILPQTRLRKFNSNAEIQLEQIKAINHAGFITILCTTIADINISILSEYTYRDVEIHLGYSTIYGTIGLSDTTVDNQVWIEDCHLNEFTSTDATYNTGLAIQTSRINTLKLSESKMNSRSTFVNTLFREARFINTEFNNSVAFCKPIPDVTPLSDVGEVLGEEPCAFKETPLFMGTQFNAGAIFAGVEFESGGNFLHAEFQDGCTFQNTDFNIGCHFSFAEFNAESAFFQADLGTSNFEKTKFYGPVVFDQASFGTGRSYTKKENIEKHAQAEGIEPDTLTLIPNILNDFIFDEGIVSVSGKAASFDNIQSDDLMSAKRSDSKGMITAFNSKLYFLDLDLRFDSSSPTISFYGSKIEGGTIRISREDSFYELVNATIGDIHIVSDTEKNAFKNILIENTRFEGFGFSDYRKELREIGWEIDGYFHDGEHNPSDHREATYSKAKSGAERVGDYYAESKFFIKEQRSRRTLYRENINDSNSTYATVSNIFNYSTNLFYDISSKYAESPGYVVGWSIILIILFSTVYQHIGIDLPYELSLPIITVESFLGSNPRLVLLDLPYGTRLPVITGIFSDSPQIAIKQVSGFEYIIFSLESFSAFMLSANFEITNPVIRLFSSIQAFSGAFLIALFVASIIRTVKR